ncbi:MAG: hypothetical protein HY017_06790 [Betaproteobacteria bacterium]|nr:hypothetical protein [Betaproteobacteria bacterium]
MPYARRNPEGRIVAMLAEPEPNAQELLPVSHPDVRAFLGGGEAASFGNLDADFIRVTEDLINTLVERRLLQFMDLPPEAQRKLRERESFRGRRVKGALYLLGDGNIV